MSSDITIGILRDRHARFQARANQIATEHNAIREQIAGLETQAAQLAGAHSEILGVVSELAEALVEAGGVDVPERPPEAPSGDA